MFTYITIRIWLQSYLLRPCLPVVWLCLPDAHVGYTPCFDIDTIPPNQIYHRRMPCHVFPVFLFLLFYGFCYMRHASLVRFEGYRP